MKKALIVDAAPSMCSQFKLILEKCGFEVVGETGNTKRALKLYRELRPDMVTIDIALPGLGGITALQKIKEIDGNARIMVVSRFVQAQQVRAALAAGVVAYIVRPFQNEAAIPAIPNQA